MEMKWKMSSMKQRKIEETDGIKAQNKTNDRRGILRSCNITISFEAEITLRSNTRSSRRKNNRNAIQLLMTVF